MRGQASRGFIKWGPNNWPIIFVNFLNMDTSGPLWGTSNVGPNVDIICASLMHKRIKPVLFLGKSATATFFKVGEHFSFASWIRSTWSF